MRDSKPIVFVSLFLLLGLYSFSDYSAQWGNLKSGKFGVGFKLIEISDPSRSYPSKDSITFMPRPIRIYLWYPAVQSTENCMKIGDYVQLAAEDFYTNRKQNQKNPPPVLPVQLNKGINKEKLKNLMNQNVLSKQNNQPEKGRFPLIVLAQGLYYESPLSQFFLSEFMASQGYVIATCPLLGSHYRLVNINLKDLETQVRDLEFVLGTVQKLSFVEAGQLGIIGYDLGGMAGLVMAMRNPNVDAFLSLDSGINFTHFSGMPNSHPSYQEGDFIIPWMHMTQSRFIRMFGEEQKQSSLFQRKIYGNSYLVHIPTANHGCFTSYAVLGITNAVPGYWGPPGKNLAVMHHEICRNALLFFNGYIKKNQIALKQLSDRAANGDAPDDSVKIEYKPGKMPPPLKITLINTLINQGVKPFTPEIEKLRKIYPSADLFDESVLNWLGYHFQYWWGREGEAIGIFELNARLFPNSSNVFDSLGEAYLSRGDGEKAIQCYKKSLELNPDNKNAKEILKQLEKDDKN